MVFTVGTFASFVNYFISGTVILLYHQRGFFSQFAGGGNPMKSVYKSSQCLVLSRLPLTPSLESPFVVFVPWYFDNYFFHLTRGEEYQSDLGQEVFIPINPHLGLDESQPTADSWP